MTNEPEMPRWIGTRLNAQFVPISKDMEECPKCYGAIEIDMTPRDNDGWPLGPYIRLTCDWCDGEGEVVPAMAKRPEPECCPSSWEIEPEAPKPTPEAPGWGKPMEPGPVKITGWGEPPKPEPVAKGWGDFDDWQQLFNQLDTRTKNCLFKAGINSHDKLNAMTDLELMLLPAFGGKCMRNIRTIYGRKPDRTTADHPVAAIRDVTDA